MPTPDSKPTLLSLILTDKTPLTAQVMQFRLSSPEGAALPPFDAGAHITVQTPAGPMRRYSLIGDPADDRHYVFAVKVEPQGRGGSLSLHQDTAIGDRLLTEPPRNDFRLQPAPRYLFIAGGIGITPILSMVLQLRRQGRHDFRLVWCTRNAALTPFRDILLTDGLRDNVTLHHDDGDPARAFDFWPLCETPDGTHLYTCGPAALREEIENLTGHWPSETLHAERFDPVEVVQADDRPFTIRVAGRDAPIPVGARQTLLEALREQGYPMRSSCESGTCGTCRTAYHGGRVEHRDLVLTEQERLTHLMPCISRALDDDIVLDLSG